MTAVLVSQNRAASRIAQEFRRKRRCRVHVQEQRAFKGQWLCLGDVSLPHGAPSDNESEQGDAALESTAFEWQLPHVDAVKSELASLLEVSSRDNDYSRIARALDQTAAIVVRAGLLHPVIDPDAIEEMPFRHATTVVADTSGVLQGALDFVVQYLHPVTRVKIPAIVQMEIVNSSHRFFSIRRSNEAKAGRESKGKSLRANELIEHLKSQGGQRALLRFELQTDAEIERTYLLGDPLRNAFQPDRDSALRDLNVSVPIPAYTDRLILEAARHHQAQSEPGHAVRLLTSDQGLAKMAFAEGMKPFYFKAVKGVDFFGARLTGQTFNPFTGDVHGIPLTQVVWELATAFGAARLQWKDGATITISALNDDVSWSPFHSADDLLWFSVDEAADGGSTNRTDTPLSDSVTETATGKISAAANRVVQKASFHQMSAPRLLQLICALDDHQVLDSARVSELLRIGARSADEYRRFLLSADLLSMDGDRWRATSSARRLSAELRNGNAIALRDALQQAPSFAALRARIARSEMGRPINMSDLSRGAAVYRTLGEMTLICASVGRDVYATPARPGSVSFAQTALRRFGDLDRGDGLVATGRWLESLIRQDGIHPEIARRSLEEADDAGLLRRSTEGSTTQTAFDDHVVHVLRTDARGMPVVMPVHLYRGDYLIPGKASVSLRIEERP